MILTLCARGFFRTNSRRIWNLKLRNFYTLISYVSLRIKKVSLSDIKLLFRAIFYNGLLLISLKGNFIILFNSSYVTFTVCYFLPFFTLASSPSSSLLSSSLYRQFLQTHAHSRLIIATFHAYKNFENNVEQWNSGQCDPILDHDLIWDKKIHLFDIILFYVS